MRRLSPFESRWEALLHLVMVAVAFLPTYGLIPRATVFAYAVSGLPGLQMANAFCWGMVGLCVPVLGAHVFFPEGGFSIATSKTETAGAKKEVPPIIVCGMSFSYNDLFQNFLITGRIGSGKTAVAIWSILEQMFTIFSLEKAEQDWEQKFLAMGGLALDVKGHFAEAILYFAHMAKRNVVESIRIIRPKVRIPAAKFRDERGYYFFLSAMHTTAGTEFDRLLAKFTDKKGRKFLPNIFDMKIEDRKAAELELSECPLDVRGYAINYVGWRWQGEYLVRVSHTPGFEQVAYVNDESGKAIRISPPKELRFVEFIGVDNGLRFNIINPRLSSAEAAKRLVNIGKLAAGDSGGGDGNQYWSDAAARQIGMCIEGWRILRPSVEITGPDVLRISTQMDVIKEFTEGLRDKSAKLEIEAAAQANPDRKKELVDLRQKCEDIRKYFQDSWIKLEPKTKGITESVIQNMFGVFLTDGNLKESFCSPSTIDFLDCCEKGTFFCFVPGREYESLAKIMTTSLKQEFQSAMLERPASPHLNKTRTAALIIDECQSVAVAGGKNGGGDEHFKAIAREARVVGVEATQSDSSLVAVIGRDNADVYLQPYGGRVYLANPDPATNKRASELCGKIYRERGDMKNPDFKMDALFGGDADKVKRGKDIHLTDRYRPDEFANLDNLESITINMGKNGRKAKVHKQKNVLHPYASEAGRKKLCEILAWYSYAVLEQEAWRAGRVGLFDHILAGQAPIAAPTQFPAPMAAPAPAAAPTQVTPAPSNAAPVPAAAPTAAPSAAPLPPPADGAPASDGIIKTSTWDHPTLLPRSTVLLKANPYEGVVRPPPPAAAPAKPEEVMTSYGEIVQVQAVFQNKEAGIALATDAMERVLSTRLLNPQSRPRELAGLAQDAQTADPIIPDRDAIGPRGDVLGKKELMAVSLPHIKARKQLPKDESLDLGGTVNIRKIKEHAQVTQVPETPAEEVAQRADIPTQAMIFGRPPTSNS